MNAMRTMPRRRGAMRCGLALAAGLATLLVPSASFALDGNTITSPSGFNHCHWYRAIPFAARAEPGVVCTSTRGPKSGFAVVLTSSGRRWTGYAAHRWLFSAGPRVPYGSSRARYGITCASLTTGLRCVQRPSGQGIFVNTNVHGFFSLASPGLIDPQ